MDKNWQIKTYEVLSSTNDEALKFCDTPGQQIVICAKTQTAGRGRRGRKWISQKGNLFFSQVMEFDLSELGILIMIVSLSVAQTIHDLSKNATVSIKWPNDIILNNAKVCGILLEKGSNNYIIAGIGINIATSPDNSELIYPTTSLKAAHILTTPEEFLGIYLKNFDKNKKFREQNGNRQLMEKWLQNAYNLHKRVIIRQEKKEFSGIFTGIDDNAALLLQTEGKTEKIYAGDMMYMGEHDD